MEEDRREFLKLFGAALAALLAPAQVLHARPTRVAIPLPRVEKLKEVGGWVILAIKGRNVMFIRDAEDSIRAFDPICTHRRCTVGYNPAKRLIECPCHGSTFEPDGRVKTGPAERPLKSYVASLSGEHIILTIEE